MPEKHDELRERNNANDPQSPDGQHDSQRFIRISEDVIIDVLTGD